MVCGKAHQISKDFQLNLRVTCQTGATNDSTDFRQQVNASFPYSPIETETADCWVTTADSRKKPWRTRNHDQHLKKKPSNIIVPARACV